MSQFAALLVGVASYDDLDIESLEFVPHDVAALGAALERSGYAVSPFGGGTGRVGLLKLKALVQSFLGNAHRGDSLLVYISGHGVHANGSDYLVPSDAETSLAPFTDGCLRIGWERELEETRAARVLFVVDACREGFSQDTMSVGLQRWGTGKRQRVAARQASYLFACSPGETARILQDQDGRFSLFSRALTSAVAATARLATLSELEQAVQVQMDLLVDRRGGRRQRLRVDAGESDKASFVVFPGGLRDRPAMAPASQRIVVPRPGLAEPLIELLCRPGPLPAPAVAALRGTGGFGKTTLAEAVCRDVRVNDRFPGGILWADVGVTSESRLAGEINKLTRVVTGEQPLLLDPEQAGARLGSLIDDLPTLLVIDDIWTPGQLRPFLFDSRTCVRLLTTRNAQVVPPGVQSLAVEAMEHEEARALLLRGVGEASEDRVDRLLALTGNWPVLLALINGAVYRWVDQDNSVDDALAAVESLLRAGGPASLDWRQPEERSHAVDMTMEISLRFLAEGGRTSDVDRYLELAIFPDGDDIPLPVLERFWAATGGLSPLEVQRLCMDLADMSLVLRYQLAPPQLRLHDVVREYLRHRLGPERLRQLSRMLLELSAESELDSLFDEDD